MAPQHTSWRLIPREEMESLGKREMNVQFTLLSIMLKNKFYPGLLSCSLEIQRGIIITMDIDVDHQILWKTILELTSTFTVYILEFSTKILCSILQAYNEEVIPIHEKFTNDLENKENQRLWKFCADEEVHVKWKFCAEEVHVKGTFPSAETDQTGVSIGLKNLAVESNTVGLSLGSEIVWYS